MMNTRKPHWASLLTLIAIGLGVLSFLAIAMTFGIEALTGLLANDGSSPGAMSGVLGYIFEALVLILCGWFVLQKVSGMEAAEGSSDFPFKSWQAAAIPVVVVFSILLGGGIAYLQQDLLSLVFLPPLTVIVIALPIWLACGIAIRGIDPGPRWRAFSTFGLGMTLSPLLMGAIEVVFLIAVIIAGVIYVAITNPALFAELGNLAETVTPEMGEQTAFALLGPYISRPAVMAVVFGFIAVFVPLLEELFKPLAVWLFARRLESPAQGFVLGILSGGAFALLESMNAAASASGDWAVIVTARIGTGLLHTLTTGLVGWGIASAFREKRIGRLAACYLTAVLIHGIWNASAAGTAWSSLGEYIGKPEWFYQFAPALLCGMGTMGIGMAAVLIAANRKLRLSSPPPVMIEEKVESPA